MPKYIVTKERTAIQQWLIEAPDETSALSFVCDGWVPTDTVHEIDLIEDDYEDTWTATDA